LSSSELSGVSERKKEKRGRGSREIFDASSQLAKIKAHFEYFQHFEYFCLPRTDVRADLVQFPVWGKSWVSQEGKRRMKEDGGKRRDATRANSKERAHGSSL